MSERSFKRLPQHVGLIPDGNRRWAEQRGLPREAGYSAGIEPGWRLLKLCQELGIEEASVYGFTKDNVHRPKAQTDAFRAACVAFAQGAVAHDIALLAVGDTRSPLFPDALRPFAGERRGGGPLRVNFLVNYGWDWDLNTALRAVNGEGATSRSVVDLLASADVSRIDMVVRWGGRRRLSGFLPVQSVYADFYVVDDLWPDYKPEHFYAALEWYQTQDVTLGG
jgi:undecaprenyl diphosphate synthase